MHTASQLSRMHAVASTSTTETDQWLLQEKEARLTSVLEELTAEKNCHAQTSKKLEQAKGALERKTATVARLKEAQSSASNEPVCATSAADLEKKVQSLQAAIDKKEEALRQVQPHITAPCRFWLLQGSCAAATCSCWLDALIIPRLFQNDRL